MCGVGVNVWLCPTSTNGVSVDVVCYLINGWGLYGFISVTEESHFNYMPVFWQHNIIRAGIYDCIQKVYW